MKGPRLTDRAQDYLLRMPTSHDTEITQLSPQVEISHQILA